MKTLHDLYQYFDSLIEQDDDDLLFSSSYLRGFIALAAVSFGDEQQPLSSALANSVDQQVTAAKVELSPRDRVLVQNYWQQLQPAFCY